MKVPSPYSVVFEDGEWVVSFWDAGNELVDIIEKFHGTNDAPARKLCRHLNWAYFKGREDQEATQ